MCLLWFKKIFKTQYRDVTWTLEDTREAKTIFTQYMMIPGTGNRREDEMAMYQRHGMTLHWNVQSNENEYLGDCKTGGGDEAISWIRNVPELTCFCIGTPVHVMAGFWQKGKAFFFDANAGVFEFSNINDFAENVVDLAYIRYLKPDGKKVIGFQKVINGT